MRQFNILFTAMAMILVPSAGLADDYQDCQSICASEKESRNMNCPSPYEASDSGDGHAQCMKGNRAAYDDCLNYCSSAPPQPPSSNEQTSPPRRWHTKLSTWLPGLQMKGP